jgi:hypothetical protein
LLLGRLVLDYVPVLDENTVLDAEDAGMRGRSHCARAPAPSRACCTVDGEEVEPLLAKTAAAAAGGDFEPFKTSSIFDSTAEHPEWLGEEPPRIREPLSS